MIDAAFGIVSWTLGCAGPSEQVVAATSTHAALYGSEQNKHHWRVWSLGPSLHTTTSKPAPMPR
jgi:hypothetical protein